MNLRSGRYLGSRQADLISRISTHESGTHSVGNLEGILECSSSDTQSDSMSLPESGMEGNPAESFDMHADRLRKGKMSKNPFDEPTDEMDFDVTLSFLNTNAYGAEIYKDPLGRYTFKSAEYRTPFSELPLVNYQGDLYMGMDGARYEVTKHPNQVDALGVLQTGQAPIAEQEAESYHEQAGTSNELPPPGTQRSQIEQNIEKLIAAWKVCKDNELVSEWKTDRVSKVTKVSQDSPMQEVFRDSAGVYYATTKLPNLQYASHHLLTVESQGEHNSRIIDREGNQFRALEWNEVRGLT